MSTNIGSQFVHVVGAWFGYAHEPEPEELFTALIKELHALLRDGVVLTDSYLLADAIPKNVRVKYITCDIPAMALCKGIKGGQAYGACTKCSV